MTKPYLISVKITLSRPLYCWNKYRETKKRGGGKDDIKEHFFPRVIYLNAGNAF